MQRSLNGVARIGDGCSDGHRTGNECFRAFGNQLLTHNRFCLKCASDVAFLFLVAV